MKPLEAHLPPRIADALEGILPLWHQLDIPDGSRAVILGSGLGPAADSFPLIWERSFTELGLPTAQVVGHRGFLRLVDTGGIPLLFMQGRLHRYEGHPDEMVLLPHAALAALNPSGVLVTNAAGGLDPAFDAGDFMLIRDIVSLQLRDPLRGESGGVRRAGRTPLFDVAFSSTLQLAAARAELTLREGLLSVADGPAYETRAEIGLVRLAGGQALSMSTFPEAVLLSRLGLPLAGISCITNVIRDDREEPLTHDEVVETGRRVASDFGRLLAAWARES